VWEQHKGEGVVAARAKIQTSGFEIKYVELWSRQAVNSNMAQYECEGSSQCQLYGLA
jgi:hypothetical protein